MPDIKVIKIDTDGGFRTEHDTSADSIKMVSFKTANKELTDAKLANIIDGAESNDEHIHDLRYYQETEHINASAGVGDAGKPIVTNAAGLVDGTFIDASGIDHGALGGLGDDDHTQYTLADGTRAFTGNQSMGTNKITSLAPGTAQTDAVNLSQLESVQAGLDLKESVRLATTASLPTYTAAGSQVGKTLTANAVGILTIDGQAVVAGDDIIVKNENGAQGSEGVHVDHGIYTCTTEGTAGVAFVLTRRVDFDDSPAGEVHTGAFAFVQEGTSNGKTGWSVITPDPITADTTPFAWSQFQGLPAYTASLGVELVGVDFRADLLAAGGIKTVGNELAVEPNDFAGAGLIDDGADNLAIDWSTTFNDAKAIKAEDLNSQTNGEGASIVGIEDSAGNFTSTNVEGALAELAGGAGSGVTYTAGAGGITKGDLVYVSANNTVLPMPITAKHRAVGVALHDAVATADVKVAKWDTVVDGILTTAVVDTTYFWNGSGWVTTIPTGLGAFIWKGGSPKNATDLNLSVEYSHRNSLT